MDMHDHPSSHSQPPASGDSPTELTTPPDDSTGFADRTRPFVQPPPAAPRARPVETASPPFARQTAPPARGRAESGTRRGYAPPPSSGLQPPVPAPAPARRRPRRPATPPSESGFYLPWWSLVVMVGVVGLVALGVVTALSALTQPAALGDQPPQVQVITSQPTLSQDFAPGAPAAAQTQGFWPTAIRPAMPTPTVALPTLGATPTLPPGEFALGVRVEVVGVGGNGLNVRPSSGLGGDPLFLAHEGDTFTIVGGPESGDGLEWWKLEDTQDSARVGWAARNYLTVVSQ